jgi:hypothetical protein
MGRNRRRQASILFNDSHDVDRQRGRTLVLSRLVAIDNNQRNSGKRREREQSFHFVRIVRLPLDEGEQVGVDRVCLRGGHPVRETLVGFQRAVL